MSRTLEETIEAWDGEAVVVAHDAPTRTWIFIALHDTRLGPATGGSRLKSYGSPPEGLQDALRLAEGMTYKWAAAGLAFGGGKAVLAVPAPLDGEERRGLLDRYADLLRTLRGTFRTGVDLGTTSEDMARIGARSGQAMGIVDGHPADPGPFTALGVVVGMRAALEHRHGSPELRGRRVLVQGVGDVGVPLAGLLVDAGAEPILCDLDPEVARRAAERLGTPTVGLDAMWDVEVDIYAPCAVGATVNPGTVPRMRCEIVAGSANNQLLTAEDAEALQERGILYAPDYVINAGGAIAFAKIQEGERDEDRLRAEVSRIGETLAEIFEEARAAGTSPLAAARERAVRALEAVG